MQLPASIIPPFSISSKQECSSAPCALTSSTYALPSRWTNLRINRKYYVKFHKPDAPRNEITDASKINRHILSASLTNTTHTLWEWASLFTYLHIVVLILVHTVRERIHGSLHILQWVDFFFFFTCAATQLRTNYRQWISIMKASVTGYQPYLQQTQNINGYMRGS